MDVKYLNPFIESFSAIMPQVGFGTVQIGDISIKEGKSITASGIVVVLGIVGDVSGNVVYTLDEASAKGIASTMMMGMPIEALDDMAKSALSELTNMLTATAATGFASLGMMADISTPTMLQGENMSIMMTSHQVFCARLLADDIPLEIYISFENK